MRLSLPPFSSGAVAPNPGLSSLLQLHTSDLRNELPQPFLPLLTCRALPARVRLKTSPLCRGLSSLPPASLDLCPFSLILFLF